MHPCAVRVTLNDRHVENGLRSLKANKTRRTFCFYFHFGDICRDVLIVRVSWADSSVHSLPSAQFLGLSTCVGLSVSKFDNCSVDIFGVQFGHIGELRHKP
jgi:hypothetical protein